MTRAVGLARVAVAERLDPQFARHTLSQVWMAALIGAVASQSPLDMPWHRVALDPGAAHTEVLSDSLEQVDGVQSHERGAP
jgi:hypothetical protein